MDVSYSANLSAGAVMALLLVSVAVYVYYAFSLMTIAHKTGTGSAWMAWVPILNVYLMCKVADKPGWWLPGHHVRPVHQPRAHHYSLDEDRRGQRVPGWWGILMLVPVVNFIVPGYLAFAESSEMPSGRADPSLENSASPESIARIIS